MVNSSKSQENLQKEFERVIENISNEVLKSTIIEDGKKLTKELKERINIGINDINEYNKENTDRLLKDLKENNKSVNNTIKNVDIAITSRCEEIKQILHSDFIEASNEFSSAVDESLENLYEGVVNAKNSFELVNNNVKINMDKVVGNCEKSITNIKVKCDNLENNISLINNNLDNGSKKILESADIIASEVEKLHIDNQKNISDIKTTLENEMNKLKEKIDYLENKIEKNNNEINNKLKNFDDKTNNIINMLSKIMEL